MDEPLTVSNNNNNYNKKLTVIHNTCTHKQYLKTDCYFIQHFQPSSTLVHKVLPKCALMAKYQYLISTVPLTHLDNNYSRIYEVQHILAEKMQLVDAALVKINVHN